MSSGTAIYRILDIKPEASAAEIKSAYRKRVLETHPDKNPGDSDTAEVFSKVKKAYDLLSNESARKDWHRKYDLPWIWESKRVEPAVDEPHDDLNWSCVACHSETSYRCTHCKIKMCPHFTVMVKPGGLLPKPVCVICKQEWNDRNHPYWKIHRLIKSKGF